MVLQVGRVCAAVARGVRLRAQGVAAAAAGAGDTRSMRLIIEGWRSHPHSYGVVAQFLALELAGRDGVDVLFRDLPFVYPSVKPGLGDPAMERRLRDIPTAAPDETADATIRLLAPVPLRPATGGRTLVFCTAEFGIVHSEMLNGSL